MPTERGRFGHRFQRRCLAVATCAVPLVTLKPEAALLPVGVLLGRWFNPDQDAWNKWGLLEGALGLDVFRSELPHRSRASHTIGISSLLLFGPVLLAVLIGAFAIGWTSSPFFWKCTLWITLGVCADNTLHIIADKAQSWYKANVLGREVKR
jgi:uncharacterized metal-binding protein